MSNLFGNNLNTANIGFCISESKGLYIINNHIIGFNALWHDGDNIIKLYTDKHDFIIYTHNDRIHDFKTVSKKIIMRIMDSIRYNIATNINIDKIIDEVIKDV